MADLTEHGVTTRDDLAARHAVSGTTVEAMMVSVVNGGGTQAQFSIPELGGMGQWSRGGMTMVGDMFNTGLKARVSNLCEDIAQAAGQGPLFKRGEPQGNWQGQSQSQGSGNGFGSMSMHSGGWWPETLGQPSAQGSQNDMSYAIFPDRQRLAVNLAGRVTVHDTGDHLITGISQQQGHGRNWTFTSQYGAVDLAAMPVVFGEDATKETTPDTVRTSTPTTPTVADQSTETWAPTTADADAPENFFDPMQPEADMPDLEAAPQASKGSAPSASGAQLLTDADQIFAALQKLGDLHDLNILSDEEFAIKKAELLARL
ncbi:hypothetical protein GGQ68_000159 [Sagittula marina]|uniref:SHOCT domain-containing protein n=1 Tax=Sagittula marina TaxID=943940 RepID=A0A7W6DPX6_9RHOB|nr:SHOCT domain-containing protein [Sagittula marina]MBB3983848.1 hypothetical protein [Sagittula marina]